MHYRTMLVVIVNLGVIFSDESLIRVDLSKNESNWIILHVVRCL